MLTISGVYFTNIHDLNKSSFSLENLKAFYSPRQSKLDSLLLLDSSEFDLEKFSTSITTGSGSMPAFLSAFAFSFYAFKVNFLTNHAGTSLDDFTFSIFFAVTFAYIEFVFGTGLFTLVRVRLSFLAICELAPSLEFGFFFGLGTDTGFLAFILILLGLVFNEVFDFSFKEVFDAFLSNVFLLFDASFLSFYFLGSLLTFSVLSSSS